MVWKAENGPLAGSIERLRLRRTFAEVHTFRVWFLGTFVFDADKWQKGGPRSWSYIHKATPRPGCRFSGPCPGKSRGETNCWKEKGEFK